MPGSDRPASRAFVAAAIVVAGAIGAVGASGCAPSPADPPASSSPDPSPTATGAVLLPEGSAADNLPLFTQVMDGVAATDARVQGRAYVDALVAAGFPKADMEVTNDQTTVGNPADSIQFSVRWDGECLVGQVGPSIAVPTAMVLPLVPGDTCLIGQTRPIDW